jgi:hypothetical protein
VAFNDACPGHAVRNIAEAESYLSVLLLSSRSQKPYPKTEACLDSQILEVQCHTYVQGRTLTICAKECKIAQICMWDSSEVASEAFFYPSNGSMIRFVPVAPEN